ncbi:MAG: twin-arginine translocation signal domain-containing protein, partial [Adlercreutzia sp.]|nr:twin-arginine translocation signal domain-containing protein [Adlercreutzia sp.]
MEREQIGKASFGRRDFLKGSVAAAAAVGMGAAAWGCAPQSPSAQGEAAIAGDGAEASPASDDMAKMEELYECWMPPQGESAFEAKPVT